MALFLDTALELKMKKVLLVTLIVSALALSGSALAQAAGPANGAPKVGAGQAALKGKEAREAIAKLNKEILDKLNLTDDQKAKIKAHQEEQAQKLKDLRKEAKTATDKDAVKEKVKELRKANEAFMKQTLTKDQLRQFQKLRREGMKELREKQKNDQKTTPPAQP
jgi:Spy/CpxP family protein refolding chaperone